MTVREERLRSVSSSRLFQLGGLVLSAVVTAVGGSFSVWWWLNLPPGEPVHFSEGAYFAWTDCWFPKSFPYVSHCGYLHTDSLQQGVAHTRVAVVVLRAWSWVRYPEPVLYLSGGPGASVHLEPAAVEYWRHWQKRTTPGRDLVLFDPRGVGYSEPSVQCPELMNVLRELFPQNLSKDEEFRRGDDALARCYTRLKSQGVNFAALSTLRIVDDARKIMAGVAPSSPWNLYALSYGTRVALELMRAGDAKLRAVVLDSVYPPEVNDMSTWPWLANHALEVVSEGCQNIPDCFAAYGDIRQLFQLARTQLTRSPVTQNIVKRDTGESIPMVLNGDRLFGLIFFALYDWQRIREVPRALHGIVKGDLSIIRDFMEAYLNMAMDPSFSDPVYHTVECIDSDGIDQKKFEAEVAKYPLVADLVRLDWKYQRCDRWREGRTGGGVVPQPVRSTLPTLLLSGEYDPTTPPEWAKGVVGNLPSGFHLIFPATGHGVVDSDECAEIIMQEFLRDPYQAPNNTCLSQHAGVEFALPASIPLAITTDGQ